MPAERILQNSQIIVLGLCIAAAIIVSSIILSKSFIAISKGNKKSITATSLVRSLCLREYMKALAMTWRKPKNMRLLMIQAHS